MATDAQQMSNLEAKKNPPTAYVKLVRITTSLTPPRLELGDSISDISRSRFERPLRTVTGLSSINGMVVTAWLFVMI